MKIYKKQYDMDSLEGIEAIPVPAKNYNSGNNLNDCIYYLLQRKATEHKKNGNMDLAIACLRKSNELSDYETHPLLTQKEYLRVVKYLEYSGQLDEASDESKKIFKRHPEFLDKRISNLKNVNEAIRKNREWGNDHVLISTNNHCSICKKYNLKVYSITGTSKKYPKLPDEILQKGGFCPDCILGINSFFDGINSKPRNNQSNISTQKRKEKHMKKNVPMINKNHPSETRIQMKFTSGTQHIRNLSSCAMNQQSDGTIYFGINKQQTYRLLAYEWSGPQYNTVTTSNSYGRNKKKGKAGKVGLGAIAGSIIAPGIGTAVGAAMGASGKSKGTTQTNTTSVSKQVEVPTPASIKLQHIESGNIFALTFNCTTELDTQLKMLTIYEPDNVSAISSLPDNSETIDPYEEIKRLKELLDIEAITQEEYDAKKKQLLGL